MSQELYDGIEMAFSACIALIGLIMILFPQKCLKPSLLEKKNGKLIGRILGAVLVVGGVVLVLLQINM